MTPDIPTRTTVEGHRRYSTGPWVPFVLGAKDRGLWPQDGGQAALEMLFVLMVLILLFFGAVEIAQGVMLKHALDVGTEKAARILAINPADCATAEATIRQEVENNLMGHGYGSQVTIRLYAATTPPTPITAATLASQGFGYRFLVGTELVWSPDVPLASMSDQTIESLHHGVVDRVVPAP